MNLPKLKPIGQPQPIWREADQQLDMFRPQESLEELIDEIKARRLGRIQIQRELDLRIKCPVTSVMMSATARNSKAVYWAERRMAIDPNNEGWQRYVRGAYFQQMDKQ